MLQRRIIALPLFIGRFFALARSLVTSLVRRTQIGGFQKRVFLLWNNRFFQLNIGLAQCCCEPRDQKTGKAPQPSSRQPSHCSSCTIDLPSAGPRPCTLGHGNWAFSFVMWGSHHWSHSLHVCMCVARHHQLGSLMVALMQTWAPVCSFCLSLSVSSANDTLCLCVGVGVCAWWSGFAMQHRERTFEPLMHAWIFDALPMPSFEDKDLLRHKSFPLLV